MARSSDRSRTRALTLGVVLVGCGTLGTPSAGDLDLPAGVLGPYSPLTANERPSRRSSLVAASNAGETADEPSVVTLAGVRVAFVTLRRASGETLIARAAERSGAAGTLDFDDPSPILRAESAWEGDAVRSPGAFSPDGRSVVLVYEAGGAIGLARSADGTTFRRASEPILRAERARGDDDALAEPALARGPAGEWFLVYRTGGVVRGAHAAAPEGPWQRLPSPLVRAPASASDAGSEARRVGDPALLIGRTATDRELYALFFTVTAADGSSSIGAAASFDGEHFTAAAQPALVLDGQNARAGSLERLDASRTMLWYGAGMPANRAVNAAIAPATARVGAKLPQR